MTRVLIFFFLVLTALPFQTFFNGGRVHGLLNQVDREMQSAVYRVRSQFEFALLPDDSQ